MIEVERQISEAPDICAIVRCDQYGNAWVERFEDEQGIVIAEPLTVEYGEYMKLYEEEIAGVIEYAKEFANAYHTEESD